jgi:nicotinate phosphoribosyltransferase
MLEQIYGEERFGLFTDLYQLTMAQDYFLKWGPEQPDATFSLFFRKHPFKGDYALLCGVERALEYLQRWRFSADDIEYLESLGMFRPGFLEYLKTLRFTGTVEAMREGTVVFPHEPLLKVHAPLIQGQLVESALLNMVNFGTLIATKASRICRAAGGAPVIDMSLRRAQGIDGSLSASRAALVGGCTATSNVLAAKLFGGDAKGTHAHSYVMVHGEAEAFRRYASLYPRNCVLLVDTYDTLEGVRQAIPVLKEAVKVESPSNRTLGIRLDSGDMLELSKAARALLDSAHLRDVKIVASNNLDETEIKRLRDSGARIDMWGVGTQLGTGGSQSALGGVYKLSRIRESPDAPWRYPVKLSEDSIKIPIPGNVNVRRYYGPASDNNRPWYDVLWEADRSMPHRDGSMSVRSLKGSDEAWLTSREYELTYRDLHEVFLVDRKRLMFVSHDESHETGTVELDAPTLAETREYVEAEMKRMRYILGAKGKSFSVVVENNLYALRETAIHEARKQVPFDRNNPRDSKGAKAP